MDLSKIFPKKTVKSIKKSISALPLVLGIGKNKIILIFQKSEIILSSKILTPFSFSIFFFSSSKRNGRSSVWRITTIFDF